MVVAVQPKGDPDGAVGRREEAADHLDRRAHHQARGARAPTQPRRRVADRLGLVLRVPAHARLGLLARARLAHQVPLDGHGRHLAPRHHVGARVRHAVHRGRERAGGHAHGRNAQQPRRVARVAHGIERGAVGHKVGGEVQPDGFLDRAGRLVHDLLEVLRRLHAQCAQQREALAPRPAHPRVDRRVEPGERHGEALHAHAHRTVGLFEGREERRLPAARPRIGHARQDGQQRLRRLGAAARRGGALGQRAELRQVAHVGHGVQLGRWHHELAHERLGGRLAAQQIVDAPQVLRVRRRPHGSAVRVVVQHRERVLVHVWAERLLVAHDSARFLRGQRLEQLAKPQPHGGGGLLRGWRRGWRRGRCRRAGERARGALKRTEERGHVVATRALGDGVLILQRPDPRRHHERRCARRQAGAQPRQRAAHANVLKVGEERRELRLEDAAAPLHEVGEGGLGGVCGVCGVCGEGGLGGVGGVGGVAVALADRGGRCASPAGW